MANVVPPVPPAEEEYPEPTGDGWPYNMLKKDARKKNDALVDEICRLTKNLKKGGIADDSALRIAVHLLDMKVLV